MPSLSDTDRRSLLALARGAIVEAVNRQKPAAKAPYTGILAEKHGVFVTLQVSGRLRGCIGVVEAYEPLGDALAHAAASAALRDPRFSPAQPEEVAALRIEISLLSPLEPIRPEDVEIGRHGLLIIQGQSRGLLLPQVAVEHKFSLEQFLDETCRKAGLKAGAWEDPETRIFGFSCEVFAEGNQDAMAR